MKLEKKNQMVTVTFDQVIGRNIKQCREKKRLTQSEVCDVLCISQSALSRIEKGQKTIDAMELLCFSHYFNVSLNSLVNGTEIWFK